MEIWSIPGFWRKMKVQIRCRSALVQIKLICTLLYQQKFDLCHNFWWIKGGTDQFDLYLAFPSKPWSAKWSLPPFFIYDPDLYPISYEKAGYRSIPNLQKYQGFLVHRSGFCFEQGLQINLNCTCCFQSFRDLYLGKQHRSNWSVPLVFFVFLIWIICLINSWLDAFEPYWALFWRGNAVTL